MLSLRDPEEFYHLVMPPLCLLSRVLHQGKRELGMAWSPRSGTPHFHSYPTGYNSNHVTATKGRKIGEHMKYLVSTKHL